MKYVNCGCGNKYCNSEEWINIDFNSSSTDVMKVNLLGRLPFENESVDAFYSSCMLEHFNRKQAYRFVKECYRALKDNGIIRVVVPDLEDVCREYLRVLERVKESSVYDSEYEYITIELLDQMTREYSGGLMEEYWRSEKMNKQYVLERTGFPSGIDLTRPKKHNFFKKILNKFTLGRYIVAGKFAYKGELHRWMYDEYSLSKLFEEIGFKKICRMNNNESIIADWNEYGLEMDDGNAYKPHTVIMEAVK